MAFAMSRLDFNCPWVEDLALLADSALLTPILEGQSLRDWHFDTGAQIPWHLRFDSGEDTQMTG